jgi:hypothetical protein
MHNSKQKQITKNKVFKFRSSELNQRAGEWDTSPDAWLSGGYFEPRARRI